MRGTTLREEVEKLHEERNMLLDTIEDLKQTVTSPEPDTKVIKDFKKKHTYVTYELIFRTDVTTRAADLKISHIRHLNVF